MQKHNIILQVPLIRKSGSMLCPVTAYSHMLNLIPAKARAIQPLDYQILKDLLFFFLSLK